MSLCEGAGPGGGRCLHCNQSKRRQTGGRAKAAMMGIVLLFTDQLRIQVGDIIRQHLQQFDQACKAASVFGLCFPRRIKMRLSYLLRRHL